MKTTFILGGFMNFIKKTVSLSLMSLALSTAAFAAEDCVSFNPATTTVKFVSGDWKIVDGNHWMFSFGNKAAEAKRALQIIKTYRMNQSCFVGRPGPSFQYMLTSVRAPSGNLLGGEDCIHFNPARVEVKLIPQSNTWKMVEGNMWMEDFGNKKAEAFQALAIVKKYRFNQQCFVGRPGPSFRYWKSTAPFMALDAAEEALFSADESLENQDQIESLEEIQE